MQLESDWTVERFGIRIDKVDHRNTIQPGSVPISFHLDQVLIPLIPPDDNLVFGKRPNDPSATITINSARVLAQPAVHLELQSLGNIRSPRFEIHVEKHTAVSVAI